jgi:hypothetical protein
MSLSAWIMSIAVGIILFGGFGWCVAIAVKKGREEREETKPGSTEPL